MFQISYNDNIYELDFYGIKVIQTAFPSRFIKQIITDTHEQPKLIIDDKPIKWNNVIYINELSQYEDFISLNKTNFLYKKILEFIGNQSLVNVDLVETIAREINREFNIDNLLTSKLDINKLINACFDLGELGYLDMDKIIHFLNKMEFDEKKLLIFDCVKFATYKNCQRLLNNFNILVVCSDLRNVIDSINELEICCVANRSIVEILDVEKLLSYLEAKTSLPMGEEDINRYLKSSPDLKSSLINFYLENL